MRLQGFGEKASGCTIVLFLLFYTSEFYSFSSFEVSVTHFVVVVWISVTKHC